jgi:HD-like signal output (HDOD) protein/ActR/RegA family two-component response regulator
MTNRASVTPRQVLFVDDEPSILQGLSRMLRPLRHELRGEFVNSGAEALERLAQGPFDVVVADLRMPGMDGPTLLAEVQKRHPQLLRIIFSGYAEVDSALRAVPVAHQYVAKPCDAETLRSVITRAVGLRNLLDDRDLRAHVGGIKELPARPKVYIDLTALLGQPNSGASEIAKLIEKDAGLSAKLLKIVNSAFFGLPRRISSIESAVSYLGTSVVRSITLATATNAALAARARKAGYDIDASQHEALLSAHVAAEFFTDKSTREDAFAAALLQNVGEIVLAIETPEDLACALSHAQDRGISLHEAELDLGLVSHAHVGAYLLGAWGLPYPIVEAVAHHHDPSQIEHDKLDIVDAVHCAMLAAQHFLNAAPTALAQAYRHLERFGGAPLLDKASAVAEHWLAEHQNPEGVGRKA